MPSLMFKEQSYGGTSTVNDASHVIADNGSGSDVTSQQLFENILGNFATVEASSTASKPYNVGDFLVLNSYLYKVISAIAFGDTIAIGTNVTPTAVSKVLPTFKTKTFELNYTVSANSGINLRISGITVGGYYPIAISGFNTGSIHVLPQRIEIQYDQIVVEAKNTTNNSIAATCTVELVYVSASAMVFT